MKFRTQVLALVLIGMFSSSPSARAANEMSAAVKLYSEGKIEDSMRLVDSFLKASPRDASARYLRANCLLKLKRLPEAAHEYSLVELLAPKSEMARLAKSTRGKLEALQIKEVAKELNGSKSNEKMPPGTIELIRMQASKASDRAIEDGKAQANDELSKANNQARAEHERVEKMAQMARTLEDRQQVDAMRSRASWRAEALKQIGERKAAYKEQESQEKAEELKRQADDLEHQLLNDRPSKYREVKLNPVGTNLYTRNYTSVKPPPISALSAQAEKLPESSAKTKTSATLTGNQASGKARTTKPLSGVPGTSQSRVESDVKAEFAPR